MAAGTLLPRRSSVLPSLIGVTIAGPRNVPAEAMRGIFRVRRERVLAALKWLCANNPLYANVKIDLEAIAALPTDDVPQDIASIVRHTPDTDDIEAERSGYVPEFLDINNPDGISDGKTPFVQD